MTVTETVAVATSGQEGRRVRRGVIWLLAIVLLATAALFARQLMTDRADLPTRIVIQSRDYNQSQSAPVSAGDAHGGSGTWQLVGQAGSHHRPVYALVIPGAAPTAVFVQLSSDRFGEYALVGGP